MKMTSSFNLIPSFFLTLFILTNWSFAQHRHTRIFYETSSNGETITPYNDENASVLYVSSIGPSYISKHRVFDGNQRSKDVLTIIQNDTTYLQGSLLREGGFIWHKDTFSHKNAVLTKRKETKKIFNHTCYLYQTTINSNSIDLWITDEIQGFGGPNTIGIKEGVVLELSINGNYQILAKKIETTKSLPKTFQLPNIDLLYDKETFRHLQWQNLFTNIPIIDTVYLGYSPDEKNYQDQYIHAGNGTIVLREITLPSFTNEHLFLDVTQFSTGDAYDRTGTVFLLTEEQGEKYIQALTTDFKSLPTYPQNSGKYHGTVRTDNYQPPYELMRFFTSFGTGHYNYLALKNRVWNDVNYYRQDITEFASLLSGKKVYIGFNIGTWTAKGHKISANITAHPSDEIPFKNVISLFNTVPMMEMAGQDYPHHFLDTAGIEVEFELLQDQSKVKLRLITTGHGGHSMGDEFTPKENKVYLDGSLVFNLFPWRSDCGTYRNQNPASGNFENGLSSSDLSRSNWCPGQVTNPYWISLGELKAGKHKIKITIPETPSKKGENNTWYVSAAVFY